MIKMCHFNLILCFHLFWFASVQSVDYPYTGFKFHEKEVLDFHSDKVHIFQSNKGKSYEQCNYKQNFCIVLSSILNL